MSLTPRIRKVRSAIEGADKGQKTAPPRRAGGTVPADDDGCPVSAVGHRDGKCTLLDFCGQPRTLSDRDLGSRAVQLLLFGGDDTWLRRKFPVKREIKRENGEPEIRVVGFDVNAVAKYLITKAADAGIVGASLKFRSPGVWRADDGSLVVHAGDVIHYHGEWVRPGFRTGVMIWAAHEAIARPEPPCGPDVANALQQDLQAAWNFESNAAGIVVIALIFIGYVCGALRWRVNGFVTGPSASGKTSLLKVFRAAFLAHRYSNDTSKAGMEQTIAGSGVPAIIDEANDRDRSSGRDLIDLVLSFSGDDGTQLSRGTQDGKGRTSEIVSSVIMFSVFPPPLQPQHHGRFVQIETKPPSDGDDGHVEHQRVVDFTRSHAASLWGRAIAAFDRYNEALTMFRAALGDKGCSPREMDSKGSLLAAWFVMTHDGLPDELDLRTGVGALDDLLVTAEQAQHDDAPARTLQHLLASHVQLLRSSERKPIAELLEEAFGEGTAFDGRKSAQDVLGRNGLKPVFACASSSPPPMDQTCTCDRCWHKDTRRPVPRGDRQAGVWVAKREPNLQSIFKGSDFDEQKWATALARCAGAVKATFTVRIGSVNGYGAIWLPYALFAPE